MRALLVVLLLVVTAGLYWFRWRPVQSEIAMLRAREDVEQRAIETATLGLQGRAQLAAAMRALRLRLDGVVPQASRDPDTDAVVEVAKLARSCRLDVVSIGAATIATPSPASAAPGAGVPVTGALHPADGVPPSQRYSRLVTVHGSLADELAMVDRFAALRPLIEVDGVTFRAAVRGGVDAGIAYDVIALRPAPPNGEAR